MKSQTIFTLAASCGLTDEAQVKKIASSWIDTRGPFCYRDLTQDEIAHLRPAFTAFVNQARAEEEKRTAKPRLEVDGCLVYLFDKWRVRIAMRDGQAWFVAKDVAEALGYAQFNSHLVEHIPEKWRGVNPIHTPSGEQNMLILSLPGLFFFLNRSDKPAAFPFQEWVNGEVLPSVQRTGSYSVKPETPKVEPRKTAPKIPAGVQLHELRMIYGAKDAAQRLDYILGYPPVKAAAPEERPATLAEGEAAFQTMAERFSQPAIPATLVNKVARASAGAARDTLGRFIARAQADARQGALPLEGGH